MTSFLQRVHDLAAQRKWRVSDHGFRELREDGIRLSDVLDGLSAAQVVEEYPDYYKGPCVLVLQRDADGGPVHVLWGTSKEGPDELTLVTAYRPDTDRWTADFLKRLRK